MAADTGANLFRSFLESIADIYDSVLHKRARHSSGGGHYLDHLTVYNISVRVWDVLPSPDGTRGELEGKDPPLTVDELADQVSGSRYGDSENRHSILKDLFSEDFLYHKVHVVPAHGKDPTELVRAIFRPYVAESLRKLMEIGCCIVGVPYVRTADGLRSHLQASPDELWSIPVGGFAVYTGVGQLLSQSGVRLGVRYIHDFPFLDTRGEVDDKVIDRMETDLGFTPHEWASEGLIVDSFLESHHIAQSTTGGPTPRGAFTSVARLNASAVYPSFDSLVPAGAGVAVRRGAGSRDTRAGPDATTCILEVSLRESGGKGFYLSMEDASDGTEVPPMHYLDPNTGREKADTPSKTLGGRCFVGTAYVELTHNDIVFKGSEDPVNLGFRASKAYDKVFRGSSKSYYRCDLDAPEDIAPPGQETTRAFLYANTPDAAGKVVNWSARVRIPRGELAPSVDGYRKKFLLVTDARFMVRYRASELMEFIDCIRFGGRKVGIISSPPGTPSPPRTPQDGIY